MCVPSAILRGPELSHRPPLKAGPAGKRSVAASAAGKGNEFSEHIAVPATGPWIHTPGIGLVTEVMETGEAGRAMIKAGLRRTPTRETGELLRQ